MGILVNFQHICFCSGLAFDQGEDRIKAIKSNRGLKKSPYCSLILLILCLADSINECRLFEQPMPLIPPEKVDFLTKKLNPSLHFTICFAFN